MNFQHVIFMALTAVALRPAAHRDFGALAAPPDTIDFFPGIRDNLTRVTWAHAVNDAEYLNEVLQGDIMMIEADVVLGTLIDDPTGRIRPIMGHPPVNTSDLSLEQFLSRISDSNADPQRSAKGVKLDFKSIEVFEASLETIDALYNLVHYPVWLNADILRGPVNSTGTPVDARRFLASCAPYPAALLSVGWTTRFTALTPNGAYSDADVQEMHETLREHAKGDAGVTFPVRAGLAANSPVQMRALVDGGAGTTTLTVWSGETDLVDVAKLRQVILDVGLERVYLDVPKRLRDQLHL